ncbi:hypothetical protein Scep_010284 [Stephania cephalantha]|uniref:Secreted protein n=1 Tax=Stephania cephalantha TaxID=152367 RepID=A0AAP0PD72_9MAGN
MARCRLAVCATVVVLAGAAVNVPPCLVATAHSRSPLHQSPRWPAAAPRATIRAARLPASASSIRDPSMDTAAAACLAGL